MTSSADRTVASGTRRTRRTPVGTWLALGGAALALNAAWEWIQLPLYACCPWYDQVLPWWIMWRAIASDAVMTVAVTAVALWARRWRGWLFWVVLVGGLLALSISIEVHAQLTGRWSYSALMPTIGFVGVSPLVQLPLLGVVASVVVRPWRPRPPIEGGPRRGTPGAAPRGAPGTPRQPGGVVDAVVAVLLSPATRLIVLAALVIGGGVAFAVLGGPTQSELEAHIRGAGVVGPATFIVLYAVLTVLMFPGSVLTVAGGVVFGPALGTGYAVVGASAGAVAAYHVARWLGREQVERLAGKRVGALDAWLGRHAFVAVLYARLIPFLPFNVLNYALGVTSVSARDYVPATAIGIIPGAFAYATLGGSFRDPTSPAFIAAVSLIVVLGVAGPLGRLRRAPLGGPPRLAETDQTGRRSTAAGPGSRAPEES